MDNKEIASRLIKLAKSLSDGGESRKSGKRTVRSFDGRKHRSAGKRVARASDEIKPGEPYIDSRDVIDRIEYLENDEDDLDRDELRELEALKELAKDASRASDWDYGEQLILESEFEDYAREFAEDVGFVDRDSPILDYIDWRKWARDLKTDYMEVDFDGISYLIGS